MGESINITEYLEIFKKRKKVIFVILSIFILAGGLLQYRHSKFYVPTYSSTVSLRINTAKNSQELMKKEENNEENEGEDSQKTSQVSQYDHITSSLQSSTLNQSISEKYSSLATSKRAMNELIDTLGLKYDASSLASSITVTPQENLI